LLQILFSQITKNIATRAGEEGFIKTSSDLEEYIMETLGGSKVKHDWECTRTPLCRFESPQKFINQIQEHEATP
jgi:hypothetical protein